MNTNGTNQTGSKNVGLGAKAEGMVDQAKEFGRDMKGQASALTQSATDAVKTQAGNLKEQAKEVASDAGDKLRASVSEQKAAGADYVGNVASIIRRTAYEFDSDIPQAGHYIRKAAAQLENVSDAMRNRDMSEIVGNVQNFARKQQLSPHSATPRSPEFLRGFTAATGRPAISHFCHGYGTISNTI